MWNRRGGARLSRSGPVCAGAVAVRRAPTQTPSFLEALSQLNDSKKLTEKQRGEIYEKLCFLKKSGEIDFEAGFASVEEIERVNILAATQMAMARAAEKLDERLHLCLGAASSPATLFGEIALDTSSGFVLIDGKPMKKFPYSHTAVVKGDGCSLAIAAASIVAKVTRDRYMEIFRENIRDSVLKSTRDTELPRICKTFFFSAQPTFTVRAF